MFLSQSLSFWWGSGAAEVTKLNFCGWVRDAEVTESTPLSELFEPWEQNVPGKQSTLKQDSFQKFQNEFGLLLKKVNKNRVRIIQTTYLTENVCKNSTWWNKETFKNVC